MWGLDNQFQRVTRYNYCRMYDDVIECGFAFLLISDIVLETFVFTLNYTIISLITLLPFALGVVIPDSPNCSSKDIFCICCCCWGCWRGWWWWWWACNTAGCPWECWEWVDCCPNDRSAMWLELESWYGFGRPLTSP